MSKLKNTTVSSNLVSSDDVKYVGVIPDCISGDCLLQDNLTYLLGLLLNKYCEQLNIIDADLSSVDIACLIANNPDVVVPDTITIETLSQYYSEVICKVYGKISDLQDQLDNINGVICMNETITMDENTAITIDALFNDVIIGISGTTTLTITQNAVNGTSIVVSNKVKYTPNPNFVGNDLIKYQVSKGGYTCTGVINIKVNDVVTPVTIQSICTTQLIALLQSDDYWDVGIPVGTKLAISNSNLIDFFIDPNPLSVNSGMGLANTKWAKWAICNGKNGTEDFTESTFRGFDETNTDYNFSTASGGSDSVTFSITANNLPPHRHTGGFFSPEFGPDTGDTAFNNFNDGNFIPGLVNKQRDASNIQNTHQNDGTAGGDVDYYQYGYNSGDGTQNYNNQDEVGSQAITFSTRNEYKTLILVQKVLCATPTSPPC